jgi:Restriction alleviation protein Lar
MDELKHSPETQAEWYRLVRTKFNEHNRPDVPMHGQALLRSVNSVGKDLLDRIAELKRVNGILRAEVTAQRHVIKIENGARVEAERKVAVLSAPVSTPVKGLLLPCPFCGHGVKTNRNLAGGIYIWCPNDDCVMPDIEAEEECEDERVEEMWNTRVQASVLQSADNALQQQLAAMRSALELARPVLDEELQQLCSSFCPPCEEGEVYDYSTLKEDERAWIERAEAALDAVEAALGSAPSPSASAIPQKTYPAPDPAAL